MTVMTPEQASVWFAELAEIIQSEGFWEPWSEATGEGTRRFAVKVSPVDTGAYKKAHRINLGVAGATMVIDPSVRNTRSGLAVERYAPYVEKRDKVYARSADEMYRLAVANANLILGELDVD
jgi:hypothetical protein